MGRRPAVFLDRDGTLIEEVGYVNHPSRVRRGEWEYRRHAFPVAPDHVADDLLTATDWLLAPQPRSSAGRLAGLPAC